MTMDNDGAEYALGNTPAEDERLAWQAERFDPLTERFFLDAGIAQGQRVLDLGSGAGHVAILTSKIVGPAGEVVGVERSAGSIARARKRVTKAGIRNVTFTQSDVQDLSSSGPFDAAVGRFILMFLPAPARVVRSLSRLVRPGGVIAFQEVSWAAFLKRCDDMPLCFSTATMIHETFGRTGANTEMGPALCTVYREAGLPEPVVTSVTVLDNAADLTKWLVDLLGILEQQIRELGIWEAGVGDLVSLPNRLLAEVEKSGETVGGPDLVGAWSTIPA